MKKRSTKKIDPVAPDYEKPQEGSFSSDPHERSKSERGSFIREARYGGREKGSENLKRAEKQGLDVNRKNKKT